MRAVMAVVGGGVALALTPGVELGAVPHERIAFCGSTVVLPSPADNPVRWRQVESEAELIVLESSTAFASAQWLLSCNANVTRTNQVTEIRDQARARGQTIHQLKERTLDQEILGAVFSRTRVFEGKRVKSVESYFATRDLEYRIFALPARDADGHIPVAAYLELDGLMNALLDELSFNGQAQATITEAGYRQRLYVLVIGAIILAVAAVFVAFRILLGKRKGADRSVQSD